MYTVYMYATMFDMKYNSSFPNFVLFFVILFFIIINFNFVIIILLPGICCDEFKLFAPLHGYYQVVSIIE